ncbi:MULTISPECIES: ECF transporter S component [Clostridium]|uniref:ECF transporter S component n=1 Tax=Clostridium cibarium TaxID=2762247 RepID=A0ABR8PY11_9CLOT|nr:MULTISPECIES: ECF transporter S component [Clostridium]MBD7913027.1 ECF transporter S component [Clostridium cibarium]
MENHKKSFLEVRQLAVIGMLSGISIFMGLTGIGFIPLPFMKATIMHIPVIIGAIIEGPIVGAAVGLVFGLFSIYQNITAPTILSPVFMNPVVAIIPRVLIGIISYYVYKYIKNKFNTPKIAYGFAAALGTITNTVGVLGLTFILFRDQYAVLKNLSPEAVAGTLGTIALTNGVPECIISVLIVIPVVTGLLKIYRNRK